MTWVRSSYSYYSVLYLTSEDVPLLVLYTYGTLLYLYEYSYAVLYSQSQSKAEQERRRWLVS